MMNTQQQQVAVDTPTIVDKLAQWLQAEKCVEMHESYERTGNVEALAVPVAPPVTTGTMETSYINCSNKTSLQGGTITINPTSFVQLPSVTSLEFAEAQDTDRIPVVVNEVVEEQKLPLPVVQTNRKRTMVTRSLSRQVSEVVKEEELDEDDSDYTPAASKPSPAKRSRRSQAGRKPRGTRGDDLEDLQPEEREKVVSRRQKNKEAAARCRQKRVDLTNSLAKEVEEHQVIKCRLEQEIKKLRREQENLRRVLENHQAYGCRLSMQQAPQQEDFYVPQQQQQQQPELPVSQAKPFAVAIKSAPVIVEAANAPYVLPEAADVPPPTTEHQPLTKPSRPQTLTLSCSKPSGNKSGFLKDEGIDLELETPSKIVANLFEQSGFTPTSIFGNVPSLNTPTCSVQQRSSEMFNANMMVAADLTTPNDSGISLTAL